MKEDWIGRARMSLEASGLFEKPEDLEAALRFQAGRADEDMSPDRLVAGIAREHFISHLRLLQIYYALEDGRCATLLEIHDANFPAERNSKAVKELRRELEDVDALRLMEPFALYMAFSAENFSRVLGPFGIGCAIQSRVFHDPETAGFARRMFGFVFPSDADVLSAIGRLLCERLDGDDAGLRFSEAMTALLNGEKTLFLSKSAWADPDRAISAYAALFRAAAAVSAEVRHKLATAEFSKAAESGADDMLAADTNRIVNRLYAHEVERGKRAKNIDIQEKCHAIWLAGCRNETIRMDIDRKVSRKDVYGYYKDELELMGVKSLREFNGFLTNYAKRKHRMKEKKSR